MYINNYKNFNLLLDYIEVCFLLFILCIIKKNWKGMFLTKFYCFSKGEDKISSFAFIKMSMVHWFNFLRYWNILVWAWSWKNLYIWIYNLNIPGYQKIQACKKMWEIEKEKKVWEYIKNEYRKCGWQNYETKIAYFWRKQNIAL